jgi:UDP-GlcNAc:undecaprenyl-phosphate GlcNAc-1-phosphate transferase
MEIVALTYCLGFLGALIVSFILTRTIRNLALTHDWPTKRVSARDVHTRAIPRLGGVAIFFSFLGSLTLLLLLSPFARHHVDLLRLASILLPASLIFILGLVDDICQTSAWVKFLVQIIAAILVFHAGLRVQAFPLLFGNHHTFGWIASLLATIFWVVLITNAFNLVDGLDGLAAGSALFSTLTVMVISLVNGQPAAALLGLVLAGAILGFLRFNFNPATIFLGDCGSLFIGFLLSILALVGAGKSSTIVAVAIPVVSFGLPILETALSVVRRLLSGQPLFKADREHIHHKLLERGFSHRQVVIILYAVSAIFGLLSALLLHPGVPTVGIVLFVLGVGIWLGVQHLNYPEIFEIGRMAHRTLEQKQIIINNLAFRRGAYRLGRVAQFQELYVILEDVFRENDFDGFELRLNPSLSHLGAQYLAWEKQWHSTAGAGRQPRWSLVLDLITNGNQGLGQLVVSRGYARGTLLVDINLLLEEFRVVLANALDRMWRAEPAKEHLIVMAPADRARAAGRNLS